MKLSIIAGVALMNLATTAPVEGEASRLESRTVTNQLATVRHFVLRL